MPMIQFVGQSTQDKDNRAASTSRLINLYGEVAGDGTRWLKSVPGMVPVTTLPGVFVRAMAVVEGVLYVACSGQLFTVSAGGDISYLGAINDGETTISGNNGKVAITADGSYHVYDGSSLIYVPGTAFENIGAAEYFGNYTILTERDGRRFAWSHIADAATLPPLNFSTADGRDDNLIRPFQIDGALFLFKERSHEIWYQTDEANDAAFARMTGGVRDIGLMGHQMICRLPGAAFMVGSDNRAHMVSGQLQPVSTPAVETAIKYGEPISCVTYDDEGHTFCAIIFRDRPAWVYDITTGEWHERAEGIDLGPWKAAATAKLGDDWFVGSNDGGIRRLARVNTDSTGPLVREATSGTLYQDGQRVIVSELEFALRKGFSDDGIMLQLSRDGGMTWGPEKWRPVGKPGRYDDRVIFRNLGQFRQATARFRLTTPHDISVSSQARLVTR